MVTSLDAHRELFLKSPWLAATRILKHTLGEFNLDPGKSESCPIFF